VCRRTLSSEQFVRIKSVAGSDATAHQPKTPNFYLCGSRAPNGLLHPPGVVTSFSKRSAPGRAATAVPDNTSERHNPRIAGIFALLSALVTPS
jgi:hypothetical protein